eukprot:GHVS01029445.1.p1 GENE.GHVS01029445.1~~GHVS01029445.1.p1  ORF type:complete len:147 (+),score=29.91 GHVS01029445.1:315-755(+)
MERSHSRSGRAVPNNPLRRRKIKALVEGGKEGTSSDRRGVRNKTTGEETITKRPTRPKTFALSTFFSLLSSTALWMSTSLHLSSCPPVGSSSIASWWGRLREAARDRRAQRKAESKPLLTPQTVSVGAAGESPVRDTVEEGEDVDR